MTRIQLQKAKASFRELLEQAQKGETIMVTRYGKEAVVIMNIKAYRKLTKSKRSLLEVLRSAPDLSGAIPERDTTRIFDPWEEVS